MKRPFREWLSSWAIIDVLGIGVGLVGILLYVFNNEEGSRAAFREVWPNLAAEVVGVWLSVRVINAVLERRNKKSRTRLHVVDNLNDFLNTLKQMMSWEKPKRTDIDNLNQLIKSFDQRWKKRKKFFFDSEIRKIEELSELKVPLIDKAEEWLDNSSQQEDVQRKYKDKMDELIVQFERRLKELREDIWEESHPDEV